MSRQLDSLLKGLSVFQDGMQSAMQNKAIGDATAEAEALAANTEINAEERVDQLDALAANLRLKLMQRGASASKAETAGASIGLMPAQRATLRANAATQAAKTARSGQGDAFKIADLRFKQQKFLRDLSNDFASQTKDIRKGITEGYKAREAINLGTKNASAALSVKTMLAKALQPGNLTDREQAVFAGNPQLLNQAKRLYSMYVNGEGFTEEDRKTLAEYNDKMLEAQQEEFNAQRQNYVKSQGDSLIQVGLQPEDLGKSLTRFDSSMQGSGSSAIAPPPKTKKPPSLEDALATLNAAIPNETDPKRKQQMINKRTEIQKALGRK